MKHNVGTMCWHISNTLSTCDVNAKHEKIRYTIIN